MNTDRGIALPDAEPELTKKTVIELHKNLNTLADNMKQTFGKFQKYTVYHLYNKIHVTTT
jgi:hypothetical protein